MDIRKAEEQDIPQIMNLLMQSAEIQHELNPTLIKEDCSKYSENDILQLMQDETRSIFVAVQNETVYGYCICSINETFDDPFLVDHTSCCIEDLCVDENKRGTGIAKELYEYTYTYARNIGCSHLNLKVTASNTRAVKFYEKMNLKLESYVMETKIE